VPWLWYFCLVYCFELLSQLAFNLVGKILRPVEMSILEMVIVIIRTMLSRRQLDLLDNMLVTSTKIFVVRRIAMLSQCRHSPAYSVAKQ